MTMPATRCNVTGVLADLNGEPLPGVRVEVALKPLCLYNGRIVGGVSKSETDEDGVVTLRLVANEYLEPMGLADPQYIISVPVLGLRGQLCVPGVETADLWDILEPLPEEPVE